MLEEKDEEILAFQVGRLNDNEASTLSQMDRCGTTPIGSRELDQELRE